jgi:cystathionine beta-lyase
VNAPTWCSTPDHPHAELDLDRLDRLFRAGARTLLLTQLHNPWGRVFTRADLEAVRDIVDRHGGRVISDEIHAPLVLPGAVHVPYRDIDGTAEHAVSVVDRRRRSTPPVCAAPRSSPPIRTAGGG